MADSEHHIEKQSISLIGFMGAGKSTIGRLLADELGWRFVDLDEEIERFSGQTIAQLFQQGEWYFREIETMQLRRALDVYPTQAVIATGGGTPCFGDNMDWLMQKSRCVFLDAELEILQRRIQTPPISRPLAKTNLELLMRRRIAIYKRASIMVDSSQSIQDLIAELRRKIDV